MSMRMDKYKEDINEPIVKRTDRNRSLYVNNNNSDYNKFDVNSNISVLKENAHNININQIKEILDKRYGDNVPKRRSISIEMPEKEEKEVKEDTKEYDLRNILSKVKQEQDIDYEVERLNRAYTGHDLVEKINSKYSFKEENVEEEKELESLINTITALELKNQKDAELLNLQDDDQFLSSDEQENENSEFYTGELRVTEEDFDDFKDMQKDIKSNSILIKVLVFIFILLIIAIALVVLNNLLDLGLFNI